MNDSTNPHEQLMTKKPITRYQLEVLNRSLDELLYASTGIQEIATLMPQDDAAHPRFLVDLTGRHIQNLRNDIAKQLEPIYKSFEVEAPLY